MERALVVGASGGIGSALAGELAARGAAVTRLSRREDGFDVTDENAVVAGLEALDGPFDAILVATGALGTPEKALKALEPEAAMAQFRLNALGPVLVLKHALRLMPRDRRTVFAAISARVGSIGDNRLGGWYSYRTAKAALNQMLHTAAVEVARTHPKVILALLHPGTVATRFTEGYSADKLAPDDSAQRLLAVLDGLEPEHSGLFFDHRGDAVPW